MTFSVLPREADLQQKPLNSVASQFGLLFVWMVVLGCAGIELKYQNELNGL
jgi:hypothetical protein